ncbi:MAG: molybdenum cofactor guanylyltransferase [Candidatus Bathyarchaeia archaeon]
MEKAAIILAGGYSKRLGQDKGLTLLENKPLVKHVLDKVGNSVEEKIVVVSSKTQAENYLKIVGSDVRVLVDVSPVQSPLVGALTGFENTSARYSLLLPCDAPFISKDVISLLFELCTNKSAVIPRWPNSYIEPLQAVYCPETALKAAKSALSEGKLNMLSMIEKLRGVRYVSTLVLQQLDPKLMTFFNVNTPMDLKKAEQILKSEFGRLQP